MKEEPNKEMTIEKAKKKLKWLYDNYATQEGVPPKSNELANATVDSLNRKFANETDDGINRPRVGDDIYVDTSLYTTHGVDDFIGGLCTISSVKDMGSFLRIEVEEDPGVSYPWPELEKQQGALKKKFSYRRGHKKPDNRAEFNEL